MKRLLQLNLLLFGYLGGSDSSSDCAVLHEWAIKFSDAAVRLRWLENTSPAWCCNHSIVAETVICDESQRVVRLEFPNAGVEGFIPASFQKLNKLARLNADNNALRQIEGLPPSLEILWLKSNLITGAIAPASWPSQVPSLRSLDLRNNKIGGTIDPLGQLKGLTELFLEGNEFVGSIDSLCSLTNLTKLHVGHNDLSGTLSALSDLSKLEELQMIYNSFQGSLEPLRNLTRLNRIWLGQNMLSGGLEPLQNLSLLDRLDLSFNNFAGPITSVAKLLLLEELFLNRNAFSGEIDALRNLSQLRWLYLPRNRFEGSLDALRGLSNLEKIELDHNYFSGTLDALRELDKLKYLGLVDNRFTGSLGPLQGLDKLAFLTLADNGLTGSLDALQNLTKLERVLLPQNRLSGSLEAIRDLTNLDRLSLQHNNFTGSIDWLGNLTLLEGVYLQNNSLSGVIEALLGLNGLQELDISHNGFHGSFDELVCGAHHHLPNLRILNLSMNDFSGSLFCGDKSELPFWVLDVSNNRIISQSEVSLLCPGCKFVALGPGNNFSGSLDENFPFKSDDPESVDSKDSSLILDLTSTNFKCPLPHLAGSHMIGPECRHDAGEIGFWGCLVGGFAIIGGLAYFFVLRKHKQEVPFKLTVYLATFCIASVDLVCDILYNKEIIEFLSTEPACEEFTSPDFFSKILPQSYSAYNRPYPPEGGYDTFAEYVYKVERLYTTPNVNIEWVGQLCSRMRHCRFEGVPSFKCVVTAENREYEGLLLVVAITFSLYLAKELAKIVGIVWFVCDRVCDRRRLHKRRGVASSSPGSVVATDVPRGDGRDGSLREQDSVAEEAGEGKDSADVSRTSQLAFSDDGASSCKSSSESPDDSESGGEKSVEDARRLQLRGDKNAETSDRGQTYFMSKSVAAPCLVAVMGLKRFLGVTAKDVTTLESWQELLYEVLPHDANRKCFLSCLSTRGHSLSSLPSLPLVYSSPLLPFRRLFV